MLKNWHIHFYKTNVVCQVRSCCSRKKEELVIAKGEYESLSHQSVELDEFKSGKIDNQLVLQLNEAIKHRDELTEK